MGLSLEQVQHILAVPPGTYGSEVEHFAPRILAKAGAANTQRVTAAQSARFTELLLEVIRHTQLRGDEIEADGL